MVAILSPYDDIHHPFLQALVPSSILSLGLLLPRQGPSTWGLGQAYGNSHFLMF